MHTNGTSLVSDFPDPRSLPPKEFIAQEAVFGVNPFNARKLLAAVIGSSELRPENWLTKGLITKKLASRIAPLPSLTLENVLTSTIDNFKKLIFKTHDSLKIETVIIPLHKENSVSICLSSQVGCVMACTFCATARMPVRRNLKSWEILSQMQEARKIAEAEGKKITGAVFMGMGEPFLNYENVVIAAELLSHPLKNAIKSKAITISTVGLIDEIYKFTDQKRPFRLSISLGAPTDEKRKKLVPVAARTPVKDLMAAATYYAASRNDRVNISYVCISGENVSTDDARDLAELVGQTKIRLDLIDVTDHSGKYNPPTNSELKQFRDALNVHLKQPVVRRYSGGSDIRAACGTLSGGMV